MKPQAYYLSPSRLWQGNDGPWSTFAIEVGTPPDTLFVLPSTSGRSTWVVLPEGCGTYYDASLNCSTSRGGIFNPNSSSTFARDGSGYFYLNFAPEAPLNSSLPANLTYSGAAEPGTDVLGFGLGSHDDAPTLYHHLIVGFATTMPFLGTLGLAQPNESISNYSDTYPSLLGAMYSMSYIPSQYWGYTAGAYYRDAFGSLTLGGYDSSRGNVGNVLTVPMSQSSDQVLILDLIGVTLADNTQSQEILNSPVSIFIDSLVPEIWLPEGACLGFEKAFGLVWNETTELYLVDDALDQNLTDRNASVTFMLAANSTRAQQISVTLPYKAFDLTIGYPYLQNLYPGNLDQTARYFPLKRANDTYYLGRTFLQEAYLAADFDNSVFHVSQAQFPSSQVGPQIMEVIYSRNGTGLSGGDIAGIVVGAVAALAIVAGLVYWFCWRKRKSKKRLSTKAGDSSVGDTTIADWNDNVQMQQVEHYKPTELAGEESDQFKSELDATQTARGLPNERHEMWGGSVRRASDQSRTSAGVSPFDGRARSRSGHFSHTRTISSNSFGQPSPPNSDRPSPPIGTSGRESPFDRSGYALGPDDYQSMEVYHELHAHSRGSPRTPASPVRTPEEIPLTSENVATQSEREATRPDIVNEQTEGSSVAMHEASNR